MRISFERVPTFFLGLLGVILISSTTIAAVNSNCMNADSAAQSRLVAYDNRLSPGLGGPPIEINPGELGMESPQRNQETAKSPYQIDKEILLDWTRWPSTEITYKGLHDFLGVYITDKTESDTCIRLMFRIFAPKVVQKGGQAVFESDYESAKPKFIRVGVAVGTAVAFDGVSEHFYVVDLTYLRSNKGWQRRFEIYRNNARNTHTLTAYPVYFERFLFDAIRAARYSPPSLSGDERQRFIRETIVALSKLSVDCSNTPTEAACILNSVLLETELGSSSPLAVSDALDNSGLAFGPRQLDLGQGRNDAVTFAKRYLIDPEDDDEKEWPKRFFRPIEQMNTSDLRLLYSRVTVSFNEGLLAASEHVMDLYVSGLLAMANRDYKLQPLSFIGDARNLAQAILADFSNKWGDSAVSRLTRYLISQGKSYNDCALVAAMRAGVASLYTNLADSEDFNRRVAIVLTTFLRAAGRRADSCQQALASTSK